MDPETLLQQMKERQENTPPSEKKDAPEQYGQSALLQSYQTDIAKALDTTEAPIVQKLLEDARAREGEQKDERVRTKERKWYTFGAMVFLFFALCALGYGIYYYSRLTVPVQKELSVGVFPESAPIPISTTDIGRVVETLGETTASFPERPLLLQLQNETATPLSKQQLFSFFESRPSEPFLSVFSIIRYGAVALEKPIPFVLLGAPDGELASKELLIAEKELLNLFYRPLAIAIGDYEENTDMTFTEEYSYNLPIRTLFLTKKEGGSAPVLFYGYVTNNIIIFSTDTRALKLVYDRIISQK